VIREELTRLFTWEERHRRLAARLLIAFGLTLLVLAVGSVLIWAFESGVKGGDIHGYSDAVFFTAVQLLTISSAITNPLTTGGKVVDVALEMWAIFRGYRGRGQLCLLFHLRGLQLSEDAGWWKTWLSAGPQRGRRLTAKRADHPARSDYQRSLFAERAGCHARHHQPAARFLTVNSADQRHPIRHDQEQPFPPLAGRIQRSAARTGLRTAPPSRRA
jgi:hypothetical protein